VPRATRGRGWRRLAAHDGIEELAKGREARAAGKHVAPTLEDLHEACVRRVNGVVTGTARPQLRRAAGAPLRAPCRARARRKRVEILSVCERRSVAG